MDGHKKHARVMLYTGEGEGKTTTALGVALRAVGQGKKVVIIQFMKGRKSIGEYKIRERLKPLYSIYQFGRPDFIYDIHHPLEMDKKLAKMGLGFAKRIAKKKPFLLILDEINLAVAFGLLKAEEVIEFLHGIPKETTVILTGRRAPKRLIDAADLVTEMVKVKHPFEVGEEAVEGLEY